MIKYVVEYGFVNREGACISYERDNIFDVLEQAQLYVDIHSISLSDNEYYTIWSCDVESGDMEFEDIIHTVYANDDAKEKYECIYY